MKSLNIFTIFLSIAMISCNAPKEPVDLIVHNAVVYTVDETFTIQQAFAIKDGRFAAVGSSHRR